MSQIFDELKRRNVIRVAVAYLAAGWLLIQLVETLFPIFGLSDSLIRLVVILLLIGFPLVLVFSWIYELTPQGLILEEEIDRSHSVAHHTGKTLDRAIIIVLAVALGYFAIDKFVFAPVRDVTLEETVTARIRDEVTIDSYGDRSIAVLPFVNMSDDVNNEYFSEGLSEEMLNLLTKVSQLRVISRSSAFSFKGKDISIPAIAKALNVDHVLEGSVRKVGNSVRITAQLIDARTDTHLWSETYDRDLDDIFAVQDEIAATVVEKLKLEILGNEPKTQTAIPEAYALFLQARHVARLQTLDSLQQAEALYKGSLAIDPDYVPSWTGLGTLYTNQVFADLLPPDEGFSLSRESYGKALELDPDSAKAYELLGWLASKSKGELAIAAQYVQRALELDPQDVDILGSAGLLLMELGRLDEAIAIREYVVARNPVSAVSHSNLGALYYYRGDFPRAKASFSKSLVLSPNYFGGRYFLGLVELFSGNAEAALENFEQESIDAMRIKGRALAYYTLGQFDASDSALTELVAIWGKDYQAEIAHVYAYRNELDSAFEWLNSESSDSGGWGEAVLSPLYQNLYRDPRWQEFLERMGVTASLLAEIKFEATLPTEID